MSPRAAGWEPSAGTCCILASPQELQHRHRSVAVKSTRGTTHWVFVRSSVLYGPTEHYHCSSTHDSATHKQTKQADHSAISASRPSKRRQHNEIEECDQRSTNSRESLITAGMEVPTAGLLGIDKPCVCLSRFSSAAVVNWKPGNLPRCPLKRRCHWLIGWYRVCPQLTADGRLRKMLRQQQALVLRRLHGTRHAGTFEAKLMSLYGTADEASPPPLVLSLGPVRVELCALCGGIKSAWFGTAQVTHGVSFIH